MNANRSGWLEKTGRLHRVHFTSLATQKNARAATAASQPPPEIKAAPIAKPRTASVADQTILLSRPLQASVITPEGTADFAFGSNHSTFLLQELV